jgi:general secretion pathway protein G
VSSVPDRHRGFTLLELMVVIAVMAVLAAVVAPNIFRHVGDARAGAARTQVELLSLALGQYALDNGQFPSTAQGLAALRSQPQDDGGRAARHWRGPYLAKEVPLDPWGRPYLYASPGTQGVDGFDLYSLGRDGQPGGDGEDADITSWGGAAPTGARPAPGRAP